MRATRAASATVGSRSRVWTDDDWAALARIDRRRRPALATLEARAARDDEVEALVAAWTRPRRATRSRRTLQAAGIEAVPVEDFGDLHDDPQLAQREHFVPLTHPFLGAGLVRAQRLPALATPGGYDRAGPTLGQDNDWVLGEMLGLDDSTVAALRERGAVE